MRFSDSTNYNIPKPIKYAKSDSSPFTSDDSRSDDSSSLDNFTLPTPSNNITDFPSKNNSLTKMKDNSPFREIIKTPQHNPPFDRSRYQSQNQSNLTNPILNELQKLMIT